MEPGLPAANSLYLAAWINETGSRVSGLEEVL